MSHQIKTMAFTGETPWHGLGATLSDPTNLDACMKDAGLDWDVRLEPVHLGNGSLVTCGNAVVREDTGKALSLVGNGFQPLKNTDAFEWFRPWVESGEATIETAGELIGGNRVWILAKVKGTDFDVGDGDTVKPYILLAHGHGGTYTMAIRAGMTSVRVVCNNTLSMALGERVGKGSNLVKIAHTKGAAATLEGVRQAIDHVRRHCGKVADVYRTLAGIQVNDQAINAFLDAVYGKTKDATKSGRPVREPKKDEIRRLFEEGTGADLTSAKGTAWGLYNALTEYETHHARSERGAANVAGRVNSLAFGAAGASINKAMDAMRILAEARPGIAIEDVFGKASDAFERAQSATWAAA